MLIAIIGATGFIGSAILKEALARGHHVTALAAHPEKLPNVPGLTACGTDVLDQDRLAAQLKSHDAVISAFSGHAQTEVYDYYMRGIRSIIAATRQADVRRLLVVGGAGSLEVAPGVQLLDTPGFPEMYRQSAEGARDALKLLREEASLNWTLLSPSAIIAPGRRTGEFRLGTEQLLVDANGESRISVEDYAVAMVDELEKPAHPRKRFTVGY
jgi:putative NADH-flavin reductase